MPKFQKKTLIVIQAIFAKFRNSDDENLWQKFSHQMKNRFLIPPISASRDSHFSHIRQNLFSWNFHFPPLPKKATSHILIVFFLFFSTHAFKTYKKKNLFLIFFSSSSKIEKWEMIISIFGLCEAALSRFLHEEALLGVLFYFSFFSRAFKLKKCVACEIFRQ